MARNPSASYSLTYIDWSLEDSSVRFNIPAFSVVTFPGVLAAVGTLRTAIDAITLGSLTRDQLNIFETQLNATPPTDENAQRERKWLVRYQDTVTFAEYRVELPTAAISGRLLPDSDFADLTQVTIAAFVTAFEAAARSIDGNTVTVLDIMAIGRNL